MQGNEAKVGEDFVRLLRDRRGELSSDDYTLKALDLYGHDGLALEHIGRELGLDMVQILQNEVNHPTIGLDLAGQMSVNKARQTWIDAHRDPRDPLVIAPPAAGALANALANYEKRVKTVYQDRVNLFFRRMEAHSRSGASRISSSSTQRSTLRRNLGVLLSMAPEIADRIIVELLTRHHLSSNIAEIPLSELQEALRNQGALGKLQFFQVLDDLCEAHLSGNALCVPPGCPPVPESLKTKFTRELANAQQAHQNVAQADIEAHVDNELAKHVADHILGQGSNYQTFKSRGETLKQVLVNLRATDGSRTFAQQRALVHARKALKALPIYQAELKQAILENKRATMRLEGFCATECQELGKDGVEGMLGKQVKRVEREIDVRKRELKWMQDMQAALLENPKASLEAIVNIGNLADKPQAHKIRGSVVYKGSNAGKDTWLAIQEGKADEHKLEGGIQPIAAAAAAPQFFGGVDERSSDERRYIEVQMSNPDHKAVWAVSGIKSSPVFSCYKMPEPSSWNPLRGLENPFADKGPMDDMAKDILLKFINQRASGLYDEATAKATEEKAPDVDAAARVHYQKALESVPPICIEAKSKQPHALKLAKRLITLCEAYNISYHAEGTVRTFKPDKGAIQAVRNKSLTTSEAAIFNNVSEKDVDALLKTPRPGGR